LERTPRGREPEGFCRIPTFRILTLSAIACSICRSYHRNGKTLVKGSLKLTHSFVKPGENIRKIALEIPIEKHLL
jgi:hypothetical protein